MTLFKVNTNDPEDLRTSLAALCENDNDMNGENGDEYLWPDASDHGFKSNAEYLADAVLSDPDCTTARQMFEAFAERFYETNNHYYKDYDINFIEEENALTVGFAIY